MKEVLIIISVLVLVAGVRLVEELTKSRRENREISSFEKYQYNKKIYFFTKNELFFYRKLLPIANSLELTVFAKTRLADIVEPQKGADRNASFAKIKSKHVDFLLCATPQLKPALIIELDDSSHRREDRVVRDKFVDHVINSANLKILHVYDAAGLEEKIKAELSL